MKTCEEYQELISVYTDDELNDQETAELFFHLGQCSECRAMMKLMLRLRFTLHESETSITKGDQKNGFWKNKFTISYPVAAVIVMMMFVSAVLFVQKMTQPPTVVEKTETEYVYMTSFPPVYAKINSTTNFKSN